MCSSKPKTPKPLPPPPPPPPAAEPAPLAPVINEGSKRIGASNDPRRKRGARGTNALRIDLNVPGASGNGLSIPN